MNFNLSALGGGAGFRSEHFEEIIAKRPPFRWFEVISENFMGFGGPAREAVQEIRKHYPLIGHGVCMSIGSTDPLDLGYLKKLRAFYDEIRTPWASDHLCFTMVDHTNLNDLIPLPFTDECVKNVVSRIKTVQDMLERPFLVENVTRYITVSDREMSEAEFLTRIIEEADCGLLLDVTNVYLNSRFHKYDAFEFVMSLPLERIGQMHLAGWEPDPKGAVIDSHDAPVPPEVWSLFRSIISKTGPTSALVEWDVSVPPVSQLLAETRTADALMEEACGGSWVVEAAA